MYREHFGFFTDPFTLSPNLKFIFMSRAHEETMAHLAYGLEQGEDFILITGEIGTGKTLALHNLISQLSPALRVVFISVTQLNFRELVKLAVREAGYAVEPTADIADLLTIFKEFLVAERDAGRRVLLIIDEAQNLSPDALEGLRMLANLAQPGGQVLQIVFSGQLGLGETIDRPELIQLRQRIRVRYRLDTLDRQELEAYVNHRLKVAGRNDPLLSRKALDLVFEASGGVPRLVNHLVSKALLAAYVDGAATVAHQHVDTSDLPVPQAATPAALPWSAQPPSPAVEAAVIDPVPAPPPVAQPQPVRPAAPATVTAATAPPAVTAAAPAAATVPTATDPAAPRPAGRGRRLAWNLVATLLLLAAASYVVWDLTAGFTRLPWAGHDLPWTEHQQTGAAGAVTRGVDYAVRTPGDSPSIRAAGDGTGDVADSVPAADGHGLPAAAGTADRRDGDDTEPYGMVATATEATTTATTTAGAAAAAEPADPALLPAGYCVHVASFARSVRADQFRDEIRAQALPSFVRETVVRDEVWYRVYVGPYASRSAAEAAQRQIQTETSIKYSMIVELRHG